MPLTHHLLPRAGVDPIDGAGPALAMIGLLIDRPFRDQTVALLLDGDRCGLGALVVEGTVHPDSVTDVASLLAAATPANPGLGAVVLATVRTAGPAPGRDDCSPDIDRWMDASDLLHRAGVELVEWFVVGALGSWCPRDLLGEPPRW